MCNFVWVRVSGASQKPIGHNARNKLRGAGGPGPESLGRRAWAGGPEPEGLGRRAWAGGLGPEGLGRRAWARGYGHTDG